MLCLARTVIKSHVNGADRTLFERSIWLSWCQKLSGNVWPEVSLSREFSTRYFQPFRLRPRYAKGIWKRMKTHRMFSVHTTPEKCFCDGSVWTVCQSVEIKLRCQISPALCGRELRRKDSIPFNLVPRPFSLGTRLHPFFLSISTTSRLICVL